MSYFDDDIDINDIPDTLNLGPGEYPKVEISSLYSAESKKGNEGFNVTFKDVDEDSATYGLTHFWWFPVPKRNRFKTDAEFKRALTFFKRNLKTLGVSDSEMATVDFSGSSAKPSEDALKFIGATGKLVLKKNGEFLNVSYFQLDNEGEFDYPDAEKDVWEKKEEPTGAAPSEDFDMDSFLNN